MPPLSAKFELLPDEEKNLLSASLKKRFLPKAIIYMVLVFLVIGRDCLF